MGLLGGSGALLSGGGGAPLGHPLLDGKLDSDTVAAAPAQGSLIAGDATPLWDVLPAGAQAQRLVVRPTAALGVDWETVYRSVSFVLDGGSALTTGIKGTFGVPLNCNVTGWRLEGDQAGSATFDVLSAAFGAAPAYASMVGGGGTAPGVTSAVATALVVPAGWSTVQLLRNTTVEINLTAVSAFTRLTLYLELTPI